MKRIICIVLAFIILFGTVGCSKKKPDKTSSENSKPTDTTSTESILGDLQNSEGSSSSDPNGFDNTGEEDETPTPGEDSSSDSSDSEDTNDSFGNTSSDNSSLEDNSSDNTDYEIMEHNESLLSADDLQYYYEGNGYAYGITADGKEVIAYLEKNGELIDVYGGIGGIGTYRLSAGGVSMFTYTGIKSFNRLLVSGDEGIEIVYELSGGESDTSYVKTTYVFHLNSISVSSHINASSSVGTINAQYKRNYIANAISTDERFMYEWVYPENGDYPYTNSDGVCTVRKFDDVHSVYFYNRDINQQEYYWWNHYPDDGFPVEATGTDGLVYTIAFDMVLEDLRKTDNPLYDAYFKGRNSQFAVGLTPIRDKDDKSMTTILTGDEAKLNLNVKNLTDDDLIFSIRYDVRDYYGNVVDSGLFVNSTVFRKNEANRHIVINRDTLKKFGRVDPYGIYWVNLYAVSSYSTYHECYPFMLVEDYDFLYKDSSIFGISGVSGVKETNIDAMEKIGIHYVRESIDITDEIGQMYNDAGIRLSVQTEISPANMTGLKKFKEKWDRVKKYADWATQANEFSSATKHITEPEVESLMVNSFIPQFFFSGMSDFMKKNNIPYCYNAFVYGLDPWNKFQHKYGVWQASDVLDMHCYANPVAPDLAGSDYSSMLYNIEWSFIRQEESFQKYGGRDKFYCIGETGYPTAHSESAGGIGIRNQADFNVRIGMMALAYGVDCVMFYSLLDRTGWYEGTSDWAEMNFGAFYCNDYYGVIKPKPWAAAYAAMTRQLDGAYESYINTKYDQSADKGTVRAFTIKCKDGDNIVGAWSNIYMLKHTTRFGSQNSIMRTPNLPWNSEWTQSENVVFDAVGSTVTVKDTMGNTIGTYKAKDGKVTIPLTGSPVYIYGVK